MTDTEIRAIVQEVADYRRNADTYNNLSLDPYITPEMRKEYRIRRNQWTKLFDRAAQRSLDVGVRWVALLAVLPNGEKIDIA